MLNKMEQKILDALCPYAQKRGIEIVTVEIIGNKRCPTLRVYIDKAPNDANEGKAAQDAQAAQANTQESTQPTAQDSQTQTNTTTQTNSISFDELASSQSWISNELDKLDPFSGSYTLEVSSPGIDRPLRCARHFQTYADSLATLKLKGRINNKSSLVGKIVSASEDEVVMSVDGENISVPMSQIKRANLIGEVEFR